MLGVGRGSVQAGDGVSSSAQAEPRPAVESRTQRSRRKKQKLNFPYLCGLDDLCVQSLFISSRPINHRPQTGKPPSHSATPDFFPMTAILQLNGVSKRYGAVRASDDLSMHLDAGEALGVIGPNGSGKTTM